MRCTNSLVNRKLTKMKHLPPDAADGNIPVVGTDRGVSLSLLLRETVENLLDPFAVFKCLVVYGLVLQIRSNIMFQQKENHSVRPDSHKSYHVHCVRKELLSQVTRVSASDVASPPHTHTHRSHRPKPFTIPGIEHGSH